MKSSINTHLQALIWRIFLLLGVFFTLQGHGGVMGAIERLEVDFPPSKSESFLRWKVDQKELVYQMDWQRGLMTLVSGRKGVLAPGLGYHQLMQEAWAGGLEDFYQLSKALYKSYYGDLSLGPSALKPAEELAADRSTRYLFSTLSQYGSDGSVTVHLSTRIASVLAWVGESTEETATGEPLVEEGSSSLIKVLFRFHCAVEPLPYLVVRYGGEEIYSPALMSREVYERDLMGRWVKEVPKDFSKTEGWLELGLQCTDEKHVFDGVLSAQWEAVSAEEKRQWALGGRSFFLWQAKKTAL